MYLHYIQDFILGREGGNYQYSVIGVPGETNKLIWIHYSNRKSSIKPPPGAISSTFDRGLIEGGGLFNLGKHQLVIREGEAYLRGGHNRGFTEHVKGLKPWN